MAGNDRIKVAFLGNQLAPGGGAMSLFLMVQSLDSNRYEKHVLLSDCRSEPMREELLSHCEKITVLEIDQVESCQTSMTSPFGLALRQYKLTGLGPVVDYLKQNQIQVLHVNNSVFSHLYEEIKKQTGVKIVSHVRELIQHDGLGKVARTIANNISRFSDAIVAISDNEAQLFREHSNLFVVANPFDFSAIDIEPRALRNELGVGKDCVLVAMMGRFQPEKGHLSFLRVLKRLLEHDLVQAEIKFLIVGVTPHKSGWKQLVKRLLGRDYRHKVLRFIAKNELSDYVYLLPYTREVLPVVKELDIMVRPSDHGDPWGRDIIESMALGKPIVAFGKSTFYVEEGKTGFLIPPGNLTAMAEKIALLADDPELRYTIGQDGVQKIRSKCDLEAYGPQIERVYESLLTQEPYPG